MQNPHIFMKVPRVSGWGAWGGRLKKNLTNLAKKKKKIHVGSEINQNKI